MIVVDANIVVYLLCETAWTDLARKSRAVDSEWVVPQLWEPEVLNALTVMKRAGLMTIDEAVCTWTSAAEMLSGCVRECYAPAVLRTAESSGLSAYDAHYVALARSCAVKLVTEDRKILTNCPDVACSMKAFLGQTGHPVLREKRSAYTPRTKRSSRSQ